MKKVFSLILAVAMVLSLGSVVFAATTDAGEYLTSSQAKNVNGSVGYVNDFCYLSSRAFKSAGSKLIFGKEYYLPIIANEVPTNTDVFTKVSYATFAKQIGSLKVVAEWTEGGEYIAEVGIKPVFVAKDYKAGYSTTSATDIYRNVYAIYVKTTGSASEKQTIVGELKVTGTPGAGEGKGIGGNDDAVDTIIPVDVTIDYESKVVTDTDSVKTISGGICTTKAGTMAFKSVGTSDGIANTRFDATGTAGISKFTFNDDITAELDGTVNKSYLVNFNTYDNADVIAANPDAAIMFYNIECNFRESAEITVDPIDEEGTNYLYQVLPSGAVKNLTDTYSVDDEYFTFTARKLTGSYILSDMPLVF